MKTKTIEGWVMHDDIEFTADISTFETEPDLKDWKFATKATLTYEIEEPKIEITPSRLLQAMEKYNLFAVGPMSFNYDLMVKELFGEIE